MGQFELLFAVNDLPDETVLRIHEDLAVFTAAFGGLTVVTVTAEGDDVMDVARQVVTGLERIPGVHVERCCEDLVTLADIADRAEVTEDVVRQWMQAPGAPDRSFPKPYLLADGGLWLWADVNDWLRETGTRSSFVRHPAQTELLQINYWLAQRARANP
ncbi:hypothetical protein [Amycolatopsis sp. MEPSY49]|uniref:hypothetical protein n=1 Tax=Amycolatopsis sp. MEPSY49 TaxID=3151600 RepID=UPI003EF220ED